MLHLGLTDRMPVPEYRTMILFDADGAGAGRSMGRGGGMPDAAFDEGDTSLDGSGAG